MTDILLLPGDLIWLPEELDSLPVGSVVSVWADANTSFTLDDQGRWTRGPLGRVHDLRAGIETDPGYYTLRSYPVENSPAPLPTLRRFQWAFRDTVRNGSLSYGEGQREVEEVVRRFDLSDERFPMGTGLRMTNFLDVNRIPVGSTAYIGSPRMWRRFGLAQRGANGWQPLLGPMSGSVGEGRTVLDLVAGVKVHPDWMIEDATEDDAAAITDFKARIWAFGWKAKQNHSWCTALENILARVQIDATCVRPPTYGDHSIGDRVTPEVAATLPVGTVLRWQPRSDGGTTSWYERVNESGNTAGTRLVFGYRRDGSVARQAYAATMEVMSLPVTDGPDPGVLLDFERWNHVPTGTEFRYRASTARYFKCVDGRLYAWGSAVTYPAATDLPESGSFGLADFTTRDELLAISFPGSPLRSGR